jgi:DNA adenine methylase
VGGAEARDAGLDRLGLSLPVEGIGEMLARSVADKARRLVRLEERHEKVFPEEELFAHLLTALQAGYYTAVRDSFEPRSRAEELARFYFVRQLCYGSMFRYSREGKFNIPYGGISYNRVDFRKRAGRLFSPTVRELLSRAELTDGDFADHLGSVWGRLGPGSFVFLDPPYDTEFSSYANRAFGMEDQKRLAAVFAELPCPALLVIQETEAIRSLYEAVGKEREARGRPFFLGTYGKLYGYNVRGRNERRARHLLVGNYERPAGPLFAGIGR